MMRIHPLVSSACGTAGMYCRERARPDQGLVNVADRTHIRPMQNSDADAIARMHREGIPQGFLSRLGSKFRVTMYRGIADAPSSGVWVAVNQNGSIIGFISGTTHVSNCYKSVLFRHGFVMAMHAMPAIVSLANWKHIFETLSYPNREINSAPRSGSRPEPSAELLSIVVNESGRGTGAASMLVSALENGFRSWGHYGSYRVVTMATDPRSNRFYEKVGFRHIRSFQHHGVDMNLYHKDIGD